MRAATSADVKRWLEVGAEKGATHVIIRCDWFALEDYPVYVMPGEDPDEATRRTRDMTMEVYSLTGKHSIAFQLAESRSFHHD